LLIAAPLGAIKMHGTFQHTTNSTIARETRVNLGKVRLYQRRDPDAPFSRGQNREREIMVVVSYIFGAAALPDDDFGREALFEILNQYRLNGATPEELLAYGRAYLPEMDDDDSLDIMIKKIGIGRKRWANDIARIFGVDYQMRTLLDLRTIGACDMTKKQRDAIQRQKEAADKQWTREQAGAKPQSQSERRRKPWDLQGISESTYRRRKRTAKKAANNAVTALRQSYSSLFSLTECGHPETEPPQPHLERQATAGPQPALERQAVADPQATPRQAPSSFDQPEPEAIVSEAPAVHAAEPAQRSAAMAARASLTVTKRHNVTPTISAAMSALECARLHLNEVTDTVMQSDDPASLQHLLIAATSEWRGHCLLDDDVEQRQ
jgi:hypothetical protein